MNLKLCNLGNFKNDSPVKALIRKAGTEFPAAFPGALAEAYRQKNEDSQKKDECKKEKPCCRIVRAVVDGEIAEAVVLTLAEDASIRTQQKGVVKLLAKLAELKVEKTPVLLAGEFSEDEIIQLAKFMLLGDYKFDRFQKKDEECCCGCKKLSDLSLYANIDEAKGEELLAEATLRAECIAKARDLVNLPANHLPPRKLAEAAEELGKAHGFEVEVFGPDYIKEMGMEAYMSVAKGSDEEPRLIVMRYRNNPESDKTLALVGKAICYDSGGYAVKPAEGMLTMFTDMGGSAAVITAITALARAKAKVNVVAIAAACENMISGHAYRNGDIIGSMDGKFIEVINTDAEGRLTLADAVAYARLKENADTIIDIATLTGACGIALGDKTTACITYHDDLFAIAENASKLCGDNIWRLPASEEFEEQNKSERADIKNIGGRMAGTVTAGLFVKAFAGDKPFMHFDIAYPAYHESANDRDPKGASGVGCELLYLIAKDFFK